MSTIPFDSKDGDKNVYDTEARVQAVDIGAADVDYIDQAYLSASRFTRIFRSTLFQMFMFGAYVVGSSKIRVPSLTFRQHSIRGPSDVRCVSHRVSHMSLRLLDFR